MRWQRASSPVTTMTRPTLRQASLIIPSTGERLKKRITLRDPAFYEPPQSLEGGETSPLLPTHQLQAESSASASGNKLSRFRSGLYGVFAFIGTDNGHGVFKCSLAYLLGTLLVFATPLSALLGTFDGKHLVANIVVWFHPARSVGSMHKATILALIAFTFATTFSFVGMAVSAFFAARGLIVLGHAFVLLVFCAGGLGAIAWVKQRFGDPLTNVACSLAAVPISTVLTTEGAIQDGFFSHEAVVQILNMLITAIIISTVVNLLAMPVFARVQLRGNFEKTTDGLGHMLVAVAISFLSGSEADLNHPNVVAEAEKLKDCLGELEEHLDEAGYEHYVMGTEKQFFVERKLVSILRQLAQDLGGLRSAAMLEFALIEESAVPGLRKVSTWGSEQYSRKANVQKTASPPDWGSLSAIEEQSEPRSPDSPSAPLTALPGELSRDVNDFASAATPEEVFMTFITHLGPPMVSATACCTIAY